MMNKSWLKLVTIAAVLICVSIQGALAKDVYIAANGSDSNPGTKSKPMASLQAAQKVVRASIKAGLKEPVNVIIGSGTYYLAAPLSLMPEDSGTAGYSITWQAAKDEKVILSGGVPITGTWKKSDKKDVWYVDVPGVKEGSNFRQLFVEGTRAIRARFPNKSEKNPFLYATGGDMDHAKIDPKLVKASWAGPDTQINVVAQWKFFNQWNTVTAVDTKSGRIDIADSERHGKVIRGNWFWIEGVKEELDEPGEWYLDRKAGRLYYMPKPGINPNTLKIVASRLNVIVYAKGDVEKKTHVEYVNFKGLQFRHTTFSLGHIEARVHTDAAIRLDNATNFRIENCHFENVGGYALWLHLDSQRNIFDNNTVQHSGGGGVLLTGSRLSYMDDSKVYTPGKVAATVAPILNRITRNTVKHCGEFRYYGGGVHLDSRPASMAMEPGNYIAHNYFADLSRNGIFAFRNQGGNIVEYNHIHDAMQTTVDGACIHFATMNHLNAPNYILNNWLYDIWGYEQKPNGKPKRHLANGVFLDWATSNTTVKNNYIFNAGGKPVKNIMGNWNLKIADNKTSKTRIVPPFVNEIGPKGTATNGVDLETNRLTGSVIHYTDKELVKFSANWNKRTIGGFWGLFSFNLLETAKDKPAEISYTLPITEDGTYQISLLYLPNKKNASNAKIQVHHAGGVAEKSWNMKKGDKFGFAVEVGKYPFKAGKPAKVTISNAGANGTVVADSVAFVKVSDKLFTETKAQPKPRAKPAPEITLKGIVINERKAQVKGSWQDGIQSPVIGPGYLHDGNTGKGEKSIKLSDGPLPLPKQWHRMVNNLSAVDETITAKIEKTIDRGSPLGDDDWIVKAAGDLGLESTIRPRGRPRKEG
jgi:hypothetical protein